MGSKLLRGLSYISITFAPLILPLVIWILSQRDSLVRYDAKRAFFLHLLPVGLTLVALIVIGMTGMTTNDVFSTGAVSFLLMGVVALVDIILYVYNIVYGIRVLIVD